MNRRTPKAPENRALLLRAVVRGGRGGAPGRGLWGSGSDHRDDGWPGNSGDSADRPRGGHRLGSTPLTAAEGREAPPTVAVGQRGPGKVGRPPPAPRPSAAVAPPRG